MINYNFSDHDAEAQVLGIALKAPGLLDTMLMSVDPSDFDIATHATLFKTIRRLHESGDLDNARLRTELKKDGTLEQLGDMPYIQGLKNAVPSLNAAPYYVSRLRGLALRRQTLVMADSLKVFAVDSAEATPEEFMSKAYVIMDGLKQVSSGDDMPELKTYLADYLESKLHDNKKPSPTIGFPNIDKWMRGIGRGRLIVVAGRPGTGKTAFALRAARHIASQGFGAVPFFTMEMSKEELLDRAMADIADIQYGDILHHSIKEEEKEQFMVMANKLYDLPLLFGDKGKIDISYVSGRCRAFKRKHGSLGAIFIDYLGLMNPNQRPGESKADAIGRLTGELKVLARELDTSIVLLCQMNREIDKRADKKPVMSDLRDSGSIEQDADMVIFLHKDLEESEEVTRLMAHKFKTVSHIDMIVAKGRQTGTADFRLFFMGEYQRMVELM